MKRQAVRDGEKVAAAVGRLLVESPEPFDVDPSARPQRRFARLFIGAADWIILRVIAAEQGLTVARLAGVIVEREAKRLGWSPAVTR